MQSIIKSASLSLIAIIFTCSLIIFPEASFHASLRGLHTWWEIVFPSLLPFFIAAELLISFGVVQLIGTLFDPIMRPLFNVPGIGSFAWVLGMASGYPSGAKLGARLRVNNDISQIEAERLISFSNAASPLFIFGAIAVGFFHHVQLGIIIALCHYMSNFLVGLCMRFYKYNKTKESHVSKKQEHIIIRAFRNMHQTRLQNSGPIGELLGNAVVTSVQTLIMIGGFIIFFSVFTTSLQLIKVTNIIEFFMIPLFQILNVSTDIITPLITGVFEISIGAHHLSELTTVPLHVQLVLITVILGFNGFSVQAQVASIIAKTDIRFTPYFIARILHALFSIPLTLFMFQLIYPKLEPLQNQQTMTHEVGDSFFQSFYAVITKLGPFITIGAIFIALLILLWGFKRHHHSRLKFPF